MLIDTHTHLDDARYNDDREAMIARAREAGVDNFITIGCDLATSQSAVALADQHPFVYASIGVHPHEVKHIQDTWCDEFPRHLSHRSTRFPREPDSLGLECVGKLTSRDFWHTDLQFHDSPTYGGVYEIRGGPDF